MGGGWARDVIVTLWCMNHGIFEQPIGKYHDAQKNGVPTAAGTVGTSRTVFRVQQGYVLVFGNQSNVLHYSIRLVNSKHVYENP